VAFEFNKNAEVRLIHVGRRGVPVTLIDSVFSDPDGVAARGFSADYARDLNNLYPGVRAIVPQDLSEAFSACLKCEVKHCESFFSVVMTPSQDLLPIQCIPHYDSTDPNLLAAVIYLCDNRFSGTSFYRHRRTGYEEITAENQQNYRLALDYDMRAHGPPKKAYVNGSTQLFEVTFSSELKFNSAIVYPGRALHAGTIPETFTPPKDRGEWRLTITSLMVRKPL